MKIRCKKVILTVLILFVLLVIGGNKSGFHVDEMYTFGLSNHQFDGKVRPTIIPNKIYTGEQLWQEYTTVSPEHTFDYKNVFRNQAEDVHPPLYYMLIHSICSFFPQTLGMWMGLIVNACLALIVYWQLIGLFEYFINNAKISVGFSTLFILGMGFINSLVFFRMYVLLTIWINSLLLLFCKSKPQDSINWKFCITLAGIIWGGLMTQYYFAIYCFFSCIVYAYFVIKVKNWKKFILSAISVLGGITISILCFPAMLKHIFYGYRGTEAFENLTQNSFWEAFWSYINILNRQVFGGIFVTLVACISLLYITKFSKNLFLKDNLRKYAQLIIPIIGYIVVVIQISPFRTDRYVICIMGLLYLSIFSLLINMAMVYSKHAIRGVIFLAILVLLGSYKNGIPYMENIEKINIPLITNHQDSMCLYVYYSDGQTYRIMPNYLEMATLNKIIFVNYQNISDADWSIFKDCKNLLVYIMTNVNKELVFENLLNVNPTLDHETKLFSYQFATAYFLE